MTIVLIVLALAAGIVVTRGPMHSAGLDVRATAGQIASFLRFARSQAITGDRPVAVQLDPARGLWRDGGGGTHVLPPGMSLAVLPGTGERMAPGKPLAIVFQPDGSAAGGRVAVGEGGRRLVIEVDWLTGRVGIDPG